MNAPEPTSPMTRRPEKSIPLEASPVEASPVEASAVTANQLETRSEEEKAYLQRSGNSGVTTGSELTATASSTVASGTCGVGNSSLDKPKTKKPKRNNKTTTRQKSKKKSERPQDNATREQQADTTGKAKASIKEESGKKISATNVEASCSGVGPRRSTRKRNQPAAFDDFTENPVNLAIASEANENEKNESENEHPPPAAAKVVWREDRGRAIRVSNEQREQPDNVERTAKSKRKKILRTSSDCVEQVVIEEQVLEQFIIEDDSQKQSRCKRSDTTEIDYELMEYAAAIPRGRAPFSPLRNEQLPVDALTAAQLGELRRINAANLKLYLENAEAHTSAVVEKRASKKRKSNGAEKQSVKKNLKLYGENAEAHTSGVVEKRASKKSSNGAEKQSVTKRPRGRPRKNDDDNKKPPRATMHLRN